MTTATPVTTADLDAFTAILDTKGAGRYAYRYELGKVYARIVMAPVLQGVPSEMSRSVYCFIRLQDGAILKSASWKAPAKGVRAWLAAVLWDPSCVEYTTRWLYR
jgi:hypothetical protein